VLIIGKPALVAGTANDAVENVLKLIAEPK
jgi:hypothetical protein